MTTAKDMSAGTDRPLTPLEVALATAATDKSKINAFYDVLLASDVVVPTRGPNAASTGKEDDLIVLYDEKNVAHLSVFASDAAMDLWDGAETVGRVSIPVPDLVNGVDRQMRVVLNPGLGVSRVFDPKELKLLRRMARQRDRQLRQDAARTVQVAFTPVAGLPEALYTRLAAAVSARRTLKAIHIVKVEDKDRPSGSYMLVLVNIRPSDFPAAGEKLVDVLSDLFEEGTPVEIACLQEEPMWADLVQDHGVPPVYPKTS